MAGTKVGGLRAAQKNKENDPDFYKKIGKVGGKLGTTGGFYQDSERAKEAGKKGGSSGWTPERRALASERLKELNKVRSSNV